MANRKPDTTRDPAAEVFGARPLLNLTARELRAGLDKLKGMREAAGATIVAIRKRAVDGIVAGQAGALNTMLEPDAEMAQAERWKLAIVTAIEAAEIALEQVGRRENDAPLAKRRQAVAQALEAHGAAANRLQAAVDKVVEALMQMDAAGLKAVRLAGVRLQAGVGPLFRLDHTQHCVNLALHFGTDTSWSYDRVPVMRSGFSIAQEARAMGGDLLRSFEESHERSAGRAIDWDTVPEEAGVGA